MLNVEESLLLLASSHPSLGDSWDAIVREWEPDAPPPTVAFAGMAKALVRHGAAISDLTVREIADRIETVMISGSQEAQNAAATGFLEALVAAEDLGHEEAARVLNLLGPAAREYCNEWVAFTEKATNGETP